MVIFALDSYRFWPVCQDLGVSAIALLVIPLNVNQHYTFLSFLTFSFRYLIISDVSSINKKDYFLDNRAKTWHKQILKSIPVAKRISENGKSLSGPV